MAKCNLLSQSQLQCTVIPAHNDTRGIKTFYVAMIKTRKAFMAHIHIHFGIIAGLLEALWQPILSSLLISVSNKYNLNIENHFKFVNTSYLTFAR